MLYCLYIPFSRVRGSLSTVTTAECVSMCLLQPLTDNNCWECRRTSLTLGYQCWPSDTLVYWTTVALDCAPLRPTLLSCSYTCTHMCPPGIIIYFILTPLTVALNYVNKQQIIKYLILCMKMGTQLVYYIATHNMYVISFSLYHNY